ncbi:MAG: N-terminal acetyltransferase [Bogoriella megaspora]|nr:MAG: N-terminal acetyltransferase [Bogoriella megaspora]
MASLRAMRMMDLWKLAPCNLDPLTETYGIDFYTDYLIQWPMLCRVLEGPSGKIEAYKSSTYTYMTSTHEVPKVLGKLEDSPFPCPNPPYDPETNTDDRYLPWHAHITAVTVAPYARRNGHATRLVRALEMQANAQNAWFVDLFVRVDNELAIRMYQKLGYSIYRRIPGYYNDNDDAFDMRKPMKRDKQRKTIRENGENHLVDVSDVW